MRVCFIKKGLERFSYGLLCRASIKSFPDCKQMFTWTCWDFTLHLRRVSAVDNFPTRWCTSTLAITCSSGFGCGLGEMVRHPGHHDRRISPPLTSFFWGYVKDKVFSTPVPDITNLKAIITDAFATITEDMLENTRRETDYRLDVLRATKGANVEVY